MNELINYTDKRIVKLDGKQFSDIPIIDNERIFEVGFE